ncbi:MAG: nucleoside triphosphate pyrophosphohydrolase [Chloroflexi bacterium]|nr:nucleoside triphosphate pyrophosphohydrolase [Chloroflexota bacterium]
MRKTHNKLVRDRIPEIIHDNEQICGIEIMSTLEFKQAVKTKIVEEANEIATAQTEEELIKEIADLYEIVDTLIELYALEKTDIQASQVMRREQRGGFKKQIKLLWAE